MRTAAEWRIICREGVTAGYTPGGNAENLYDSGVAIVSVLRKSRLWKPGHHIAEVGAGNGRIAMGLLGEGVTFTGLEIIPACVEFCQSAFDGYDGFNFIHLDVWNGHYNGGGSVMPENMTLPFPDDSVNCVLAVSLFSHLGTTAVSERYLSEMARVLVPGGRLMATFFKSPPHKASPSEARTVFSEGDIVTMVEKNFHITDREAGEANHPPDDQWRIVATVS